VAVLLLASQSDAALFGRAEWNDKLTLNAGKSRGEGSWRAPLTLFKTDRKNGVSIEVHQNNSTFGFYLPVEQIPELQKSEGSEVHFVLGADAGDLVFTGAVSKKEKEASGHYEFQPNKDFAAEVGKLLDTKLTDEQLLNLAFSRIELAYVRGMAGIGIHPTLDDVLRLRGHGLDPGGVKAFVAAGFSTVDAIVALRAHGVTPDYATHARALGYGKTAEELTQLRNHGITPEYLQGWKDAGFALSTEEVVNLRNHGVTPDYGAAWARAGIPLKPEELVRARNFGVNAEYAQALKAAGEKPTVDEIVRLRNFGVSPEYFSSIKAVNRAYSVEDIVRMRQVGMSADYIKIIASARSDLNTEQLIQLRNHGVPAEFVTALSVPDRKPLPPEVIIDLRNRGISAETARKLRE
jgi:hypothetical protein